MSAVIASFTFNGQRMSLRIGNPPKDCIGWVRASYKDATDISVELEGTPAANPVSLNDAKPLADAEKTAKK